MMHVLRKSLVLLLAILIVGTSGLAVGPRPAHATGLPVVDVVGNTFHGFELVQQTISAVTDTKILTNPIFYALAQNAIQSMVRSTVNWINSGFQGSPAYATDIKRTLQDASDQVAEGFLRQLKSNLNINSPFRDLLSQNVLRNYYLSTSRDGFFLQNPYTLNRSSANDSAFLRGDFTQGGFDAWLNTALNSQNNPFGALNAFETELAARVNGVQAQIHEELGWGNGFLSWRKCDLGGNTIQDTTSQDIIPILDTSGKPTGQTTVGAVGTVSLTQKQTCFSSHIETPGSVIADQLNHSLGLGADSLVNADEFDEIVNALLSQLMKNVLGGSGLSGLSRGSSATNARPYFDQAVTDTTSAGVSVASTFLSVIDNKITSFQSYQSDWQKISAAAVAARTALSQSTCVANAQATIAAEVTPVITQAATAIGNTPTLIEALNAIRARVIAATTNTSNQNQIFQQADADYQCLIAGGTVSGTECIPGSAVVPSTSDMSYAQQQAQDTSVDPDASPSLITQMNTLTAQAQCST
jgi:hypothetical protein